jgi:hypothetical protein
MITPNMGNRPDLSATPWGADTGCFSQAGDRGFALLAYLDWLEAMRPYQPTCLFATAPDVVGDARQTWGRSRDVLPLIRDLGYPAALVAQDGIGKILVEWSSFDALFIGGSDAFKKSVVCRWLCAEAKARKKYLHCGRVNSLRRMRLAASLGCDSADGTYIAFGPDANLPKVVRWLETMRRQPQFTGWSA